MHGVIRRTPWGELENVMLSVWQPHMVTRRTPWGDSEKPMGVIHRSPWGDFEESFCDSEDTMECVGGLHAWDDSENPME